MAKLSNFVFCVKLSHAHVIISTLLIGYSTKGARFFYDIGKRSPTRKLKVIGLSKVAQPEENLNSPC